MIKYRLLTLKELEEFKKEFINYLTVNGITAEDWVKIKKEDTKKSNQIVDLFSDVVFENVLRKTQFLEHITPQDVKCFQCLNNKIVLVGLKTEDTFIDFTDKKILKNIHKVKGIKIYSTNKKYNKLRELELFEMIENGCQISDGQLFKNICLALP